MSGNQFSRKANLKCAVIGAGSMGKKHVRAFFQVSRADLVSIADPSPEGEAFTQEHGLKYFSDYRQLIELDRPEAVSICVPTVNHYEVTRDFLNARIHVLLEKPIAMRMDHARELVSLAQKNGVQFFVGHIERFNPAIRKLKQMIQNGDLGKITNILARRVGGFPPRVKDTDIAVDLAIHDIDIVCYLLGKNPEDVTLSKRRYHAQSTEDSVEFFLRFDDCSAYVQSNWITPVKIRKLNITGTRGYLELDYITQRIEFYQSSMNKFHEAVGSFTDYILRFSDPDKTVIEVAKKEPLIEEIDYFVNSVLDKKPMDASFAVEALRIALGQ